MWLYRPRPVSPPSPNRPANRAAECGDPPAGRGIVLTVGTKPGRASRRKQVIRGAIAASPGGPKGVGTRKTQDETDVCHFATVTLSRNGTDQHEREEGAVAERTTGSPGKTCRRCANPARFSRFSRKEGAWLRRNVPVGRPTLTGGDRRTPLTRGVGCSPGEHDRDAVQGRRKNAAPLDPLLAAETAPSGSEAPCLAARKSGIVGGGIGDSPRLERRHPVGCGSRCDSLQNAVLQGVGIRKAQSSALSTTGIMATTPPLSMRNEKKRGSCSVGNRKRLDALPPPP